jgi:hypothetical protein
MEKLLEQFSNHIAFVSGLFSVGINGNGEYSDFLKNLANKLSVQPVIYSLEADVTSLNNGFEYRKGNIFEIDYPDNSFFFMPRPDTYWGINKNCYVERCLDHALILKNNGVSKLLFFDIKNTNIDLLANIAYKQLGHPDITKIYSRSTGNHMLFDFK